jgi:hypothetical protein
MHVIAILKRSAAGFGAGLAFAALTKRLFRSEAKVSRKERLRQAYAEAAQDAAYQAEMAEIDRAFDSTVGDGLTKTTRLRA